MSKIIGMGHVSIKVDALNLWSLFVENKLTDLARERFDSKTAEIYFNTGSGYMFLSDNDYNTIIKNGDRLDLHISTPYNGNEGFFDEVIENFDDMHQEDKEYMRDIATRELKKKHKEKFDTLK